jgi:hypothetical protein
LYIVFATYYPHTTSLSALDGLLVCRRLPSHVFVYAPRGLAAALLR